MKITCVDKELHKVLDGGFYKIPRFQRPYLWEKEQVEDFWNDTIASAEPDYFIGSMVVYKLGDTFGVVDGQQRLTTITIILAAVRNAFSLHGLEDLAKGIHRLIEREDISNRPKYILQTESSYPYLQEHIQKFGMSEEDVDPGEEEKRLQNAFTLISGKINETVETVQNDKSISASKRSVAIEKKLTAIRDTILRLKLIFVELDNEDDAYVIFETLNTRGKDLSASDLVKNHLTRLIKPGSGSVDLPKDKWDRLVSTLEESEEELKLNNFLHHFWLSCYDYTTEKKLFKKIRAEVKSTNAKEFLKTLCDEAVTYREIHETAFRKWKKPELPIKASLDALNLFRVKQQIPMSLAIMREYKVGGLKQKHVEDILRAIENFHFMFTAVTSQRSSGGISFMYASHARQLLKASTLTGKLKTLNDLKDKLRARLPSHAEFDANFREIAFTKNFSKQKKLVQYILGRLDYHHSKGVPIDYERMTIEHIAPQNPPGKSSVNDDRVGLIGNLILVDSELNNKLANKDFLAKRKLLSSSKVWVDEILTRSITWTNKEIEQRTTSLSKLAYSSIWKI